MTEDPPPRSFGRGDAVGFARLTEKNLDHMLDAFERQEDVHVVTHVVVSLLGLIVFPYEWAKQTGVGKECIEHSRLDDLALQGWPKWDFSVGKSDTMGQLLHRVRNALAHRHVHFSSESRLLSETYVSFHDRRDESAPVKWEATIRADHLVTFVRRFAEMLPSCID